MEKSETAEERKMRLRKEKNRSHYLKKKANPERNSEERIKIESKEPEEQVEEEKEQDEPDIIEMKKVRDGLFNEMYQAVNKITEKDLNALYDRLKIEIEELRNELKDEAMKTAKADEAEMKDDEVDEAEMKDDEAEMQYDEAKTDEDIKIATKQSV